MKFVDDDPEAYRIALEAKLEPDRIRATLGFAGMFQMTHEMIKHAVITEVHEFYNRGIDESGMIYDDVAYRARVLAKAPNEFLVSLLWL